MSSIGPVGSFGSNSARSIEDIHDQLNIYARQLSTGKKATTISELGNSVSRSIDLRARLARLSAYDESSASVTTSLQSVSTTLGSFPKVASQI